MIQIIDLIGAYVYELSTSETCPFSAKTSPSYTKFFCHVKFSINMVKGRETAEAAMKTKSLDHHAKIFLEILSFSKVVLRLFSTFYLFQVINRNYIHWKEASGSWLNIMGDSQFIVILFKTLSNSFWKNSLWNVWEAQTSLKNQEANSDDSVWSQKSFQCQIADI